MKTLDQILGICKEINDFRLKESDDDVEKRAQDIIDFEQDLICSENIIFNWLYDKHTPINDQDYLTLIINARNPLAATALLDVVFIACYEYAELTKIQGIV